jgi:hypothetical protein
MMSFLQYLAVLFFGMGLMFVAVVGGIVLQIRLAPRSAQKGFDWLIQHITLFPETPHVARLQARPFVPFPSHVQERRVLPNDTKIWVQNDGQYFIGLIKQYTKEPTRGAYYLVEAHAFMAPNGNGSRWVPDTFVWEADDITGNVVMAEAKEA